MRLSIILFLIFISVADCFCQNRNSVWCFGDSAGIDFSNGVPVPINTSFYTRGSCASISDTNGNLLFYCNTRSGAPGATTGLVWNRNNQIMLNGDSIAGDGWYHEMIIIPDPADDSLYYLFSIGTAILFGLKYSIIDMRADNTLGAVIQKNISLINNDYLVDCLTAIKHCDGRDWWLICTPYDRINQVPSNTFYKYLITPNGISSMYIDYGGSLFASGGGDIKASKMGNELAFVTWGGLIEKYSFDRGTGAIDNPNTIEPELLLPPYPYYWSCEFSPSGQYLYVTSQTNPISKLWQFDTWAPNIAASKTLIWQVSYPPYTAGALKLAPDNKIYMSCGWVDSSGNYTFPYDSTMYYSENMNLGVINSPDSAGLTCDFQPWSFYLGGKRTYWGLPNNPDYELPRDSGSACDTIQWTSVQNIEQAKGLMYVTYVSSWQKLFVNAQGLKGRNFKVSVYDMVGNVIYTEEGKLSSQYFTKDLNMAAFAKGMYIVNFVTDKERLVKKFIKD